MEFIFRDKFLVKRVLRYMNGGSIFKQFDGNHFFFCIRVFVKVSFNLRIYEKV